MRRTGPFMAAGVLLAAANAAAADPCRFTVAVADGLMEAPQDGRLFVVVAARPDPEPRLSIGRTGMKAPLVIARDVRLAPGGAASIGEDAATFPLASLRELPAGSYAVQALFDSNREQRSVNAPGNLYSAVGTLQLDAARCGTTALRLAARIPAEALPPDSGLLRYVRIRSTLLSEFHRRPVFLSAGVILPRDYDREPSRRYPLRIHIGGYGARYTNVQKDMADDSPFRRTWMADAAPRMIFMRLDGDGPYGDPYQVNSANNGPYGDAVVQELIPHVERTFRAVGTPAARFLDGGSTGGWVALALQIFYPDHFNGAWAGFPDPVDFRAYQLIDIYADENAYVNRGGFERPSAREANGDTRFTMRHECALENVMGLGDSYTMSGGVWGAWNAVFGPRGPDGRPTPLWDARTGRIDHAVAQQWRKYDLRHVLEENWPALAPKLQGKIHIWVGDADDYFLDNAVRLLDAFLSRAQPPYGGSILFGPRQVHDWAGVPEDEILRQMAARSPAP